MLFLIQKLLYEKEQLFSLTSVMTGILMLNSMNQKHKVNKIGSGLNDVPT